VRCDYHWYEYLAGHAANLDPVENAVVAWVDLARLSDIIPSPAIFPPLLAELALIRNPTRTVLYLPLDAAEAAVQRESEPLPVPWPARPGARNDTPRLPVKGARVVSDHHVAQN
jgi:hypothetical protein